jgi:hypothetical protein
MGTHYERKIGDGPWQAFESSYWRDMPLPVQFKHVQYGVRWDAEHGFRNLEDGGPLPMELQSETVSEPNPDAKYDFKFTGWKPMTSDAIQLWEDDGNLRMHCGRCRSVLSTGEMFCCEWAKDMFNRYFRDGQKGTSCELPRRKRAGDPHHE